MTRINFHPYDRAQLISIVETRLRMAVQYANAHDHEVPALHDVDPYQLCHKDAIAIAASGVAAVSGDARRVLDVVRSVAD